MRPELATTIDSHGLSHMISDGSLVMSHEIFVFDCPGQLLGTLTGQHVKVHIRRNIGLSTVEGEFKVCCQGQSVSGSSIPL